MNKRGVSFWFLVIVASLTVCLVGVDFLSMRSMREGRR